MKQRCIYKITFSVTGISNYDIRYSRRCYSSVWSRPCVRKLYKLCKCVSHTHRPARPNMYLRNDYFPSLKKQNCFEVVLPGCHTISDFLLSPIITFITIILPGATLSPTHLRKLNSSKPWLALRLLVIHTDFYTNWFNIKIDCNQKYDCRFKSLFWRIFQCAFHWILQCNLGCNHLWNTLQFRTLNYITELHLNIWNTLPPHSLYLDLLICEQVMWIHYILVNFLKIYIINITATIEAENNCGCDNFYIGILVKMSTSKLRPLLHASTFHQFWFSLVSLEHHINSCIAKNSDFFENR